MRAASSNSDQFNNVSEIFSLSTWSVTITMDLQYNSAHSCDSMCVALK